MSNVTVVIERPADTTLVVEPNHPPVIELPAVASEITIEPNYVPIITEEMVLPATLDGGNF